MRTICQSGSAATEAYGAYLAKLLLARLADMRAADDLSQLMSLIPVAADGVTGIVKIHLLESDGTHIVAKINHTTMPINKDGAVNWSQVTRLQLTRVEIIR